jgi:hypothetical protein
VGAVFDDGLASAIAQFQTRHAINVDSSLGKETLDCAQRARRNIGSGRSRRTSSGIAGCRARWARGTST